MALAGHAAPLTDLDAVPWTEKHVRMRTEPFSFDEHAYLREIYTEDHPWKVLRKGAQVGASSYCLAEGIWACERFGAKVLHYLSTDTDAQDFSNDRLAPMIDDSPHIAEILSFRARGRENVGLRHFGRGSHFIRGMFTKAKVKAVDADILYLDELDEADQTNRRFALDRILHSRIQWVRELSQPSLPDYGIDESFGRSDQRFWHIRCSACHKFTCLDQDHTEERGRVFPKHIKPVPQPAPTWAKPGQEWYRACKYCEAPLDPELGEWVALHPARKDRRGYHISQLNRAMARVGFSDVADWIIDEITSARKTEEKMRVTISLLGLPYAGDRAPITDAVLDAAEGDRGFVPMSEISGAYIGVDQGDMLHIVVIGDGSTVERARVVHLEETEKWSRIAQLVKSTGARCVVMDALPNKATAKDVARSLDIPVYLQYFKGDTLRRGEEGEDDAVVNTVGVDRTESLDETCELIRTAKMALPRMNQLAPEDSATNDTFRAHLKMLVKDVEEDSKGIKRWVYKTNVANHFGMALNSARIARELAPLSAGGVIGVGKASTTLHPE